MVPKLTGNQFRAGRVMASARGSPMSAFGPIAIKLVRRGDSPPSARSRHRHHAAADLLEHFHGCERFSRPRAETVQCELCLLSGLDINKEVVVLLLRRLALPIRG